MTDYGGLGGLVDRRPINPDDAFETAVIRALGERLQADNDLCRDMWSALANVDWYHPETGDSASYSFRAAGDLIAAVRGSGNYMDWYCSGAYATVSDTISRAMKKEGWIWDNCPAICDEPGCQEPVSSGIPTPDGYRSVCHEHGRAISASLKTPT